MDCSNYRGFKHYTYNNITWCINGYFDEIVANNLLSLTTTYRETTVDKYSCSSYICFNNPALRCKFYQGKYFVSGIAEMFSTLEELKTFLDQCCERISFNRIERKFDDIKWISNITVPECQIRDLIGLMNMFDDFTFGIVDSSCVNCITNDKIKIYPLRNSFYLLNISNNNSIQIDTVDEIIEFLLN